MKPAMFAVVVLISATIAAAVLREIRHDAVGLSLGGGALLRGPQRTDETPIGRLHLHLLPKDLQPPPPPPAREAPVRVPQAAAAPQEIPQDPQRPSFVFADGHQRKVGHLLVSVLMVVVFFTFLTMFGMARSSNYWMASSAWSVFDATNVTIIGISLFNVVSDWIVNLNLFLVYQFGSNKYELLITLTLYLLYAMGCVVVAVFGSYQFRNSERKLAIYNAIIWWACVLAKSGFIAKMQLCFSSSNEYTLTIVTLLCCAACIALIVIVHFLKTTEHPRWWDVSEDSLLGGTFAAAATSLVDVVTRVAMAATPAQLALYQNGFAIFSLILCVFATGPLSDLQKRYEGQGTAAFCPVYWKGRGVGILVAFAGVLPYFAVVNGLGAFVCNSLNVPPGAVIARIINTMANTALGACCVVVCAFVPYLRSGTPHAEQLAGFITGFGGFQAGFTWAALISGAGKDVFNDEFLYDGAGEMVARGSQAVFSFVLLTFHVPVYVWYMKPLIEEKMKECEEMKKKQLEQ